MSFAACASMAVCSRADSRCRRVIVCPSAALQVFENANKRRIQGIDNEISKIRERAEVEADSVRYSAQYATLSEAEKAKKIAEINAEAADKERKLEREKIERQSDL